MAELIYAGDAGFFKVCTSCNEAKPSIEFYKKKRRASVGLKATCKQCDSESSAAKYAATIGRPPAFTCTVCGVDVVPDTKFGQRKFCADCRADSRRATNHESYLRNKDTVLERSNERRKANPEVFAGYTRAYKERHAERLANERKAKREENIEERRKYEREWAAKKREKDTKFRVNNSVRAAIWRTISLGSKADRRTFELLGYTIDELFAWLEKLFLPGMTWKNYGDWHIDHRVPLASFNYSTPDCPNFKAAWALTNLQPLWAEENQKKSDKRIYLL